MSIPHHNPENEEAMRKMLNEIFGESKRRWPDGRVSGDDDGETRFAIVTDIKSRIIRIQFSKPMVWLGLPAKEAREFAKMLLEKADELEASQTPRKGS